LNAFSTGFVSKGDSVVCDCMRIVPMTYCDWMIDVNGWVVREWAWSMRVNGLYSVRLERVWFES
jgi:hypothetical protein